MQNTPIRSRLPHTLKALALTSVLAISALPFSATAHASGPGEEGGPIKHHEVEVPDTLDAAEVMFRNALLQVTSAMAASLWEEIHEASYSLEAATEKFEEKLGEDDDEIADFKKRLEIVHLASELGDAETLKAAVPEMKKSADEVLEDVEKE